MTISVTIEANDFVELQAQLRGLLDGMPKPTVDLKVNAEIPENKPGNVVPLKDPATAAKPRGARGKNGAATAAKPASAPEPEPEREEDPDLDQEGDGPSREEVIEQLTAIYQGGTKDVRDKIKEWRDSQGYKLLRDLTVEGIPAAVQFIDELSA